MNLKGFAAKELRKRHRNKEENSEGGGEVTEKNQTKRARHPERQKENEKQIQLYQKGESLREKHELRDQKGIRNTSGSRKVVGKIKRAEARELEGAGSGR